MRYLDCQSLESTVQSLAAICERDPDAVRSTMGSYEQDWAWTGPEDPVRVGPRQMLRALGVEIGNAGWDGTYYFHGTRVIDPDVFRRKGILPLGEVIDDVWSMLYELLRDDITEEQWRGCREKIEAGGGGHSGWLYRTK